METIFTWDPAKAERNRRVHGISFETATEIFTDPFIIAGQDISDQGEQRWHDRGMSGAVMLLLVVFVERSSSEVEIIRIISARKATRYEQSIYKEQFS
jgi:uncharacterized DUF497 family protein